MKNAGIFMTIFGVGGLILPTFGVQFRLLNWPGSWVLSLGLTLLGIVLVSR